jgi:phosphate transport system permease protein
MSTATYQRRRATNALMLGLCAVFAFLAVGVLMLILGFVLAKGISSLNIDLVTKMPVPEGEAGGGVANSIVGSLMTIGIAALIGIPVGIGAGAFLSEYAGNRLGDVIRFTADVLTGVPSIVVGIFVYGLVVLRMGNFSALAAGIALAIIMLPIVARSSEEMLRLVPHSQREAALALGITRWRTILSVVMPAAQRGLLTGALLAVARAAGETAPLLFTALGNRFMSLSVTGGPVDALPLRIYRYATGPYSEQHGQAWAASLVLVATVFVISLSARLLLRRR